MNPDCAQGKHGACSGTAWDETTDELTTCACPCHQPTAVGRVRGPGNGRPVTGL